MRVWDLHPGYLSRQSLLGQHAEIHALYSVLTGGGRGYSFHPETLRWQNHLDLLINRHDTTVKEMRLRGFNHASPLKSPGLASSGKAGYVDPPARQVALLKEKYALKGQQGRIPLPKNSSSFWAHHKYSVMGRSYSRYREMQKFLQNRRDYPIGEDAEFMEKVLSCLDRKPTEKSLRNLMDHLWGYFKREASQSEKEAFAKLKAQGPAGSQLDYLYHLALTYQKEYLLTSTVFADFVSLDF